MTSTHDVSRRRNLADKSVESLTLTRGSVSLQVAVKGAEPTRLTDASGLDYLWDGSTAWYRSAPFLFPIICRVPDDTITVDGRRYAMKQHGIARDRRFSLVEHEADRARFELYSDQVTRESFPFEFTLAIEHQVREDGLEVTIQVENRSDHAMPYAVGWHPAFLWPLPDPGSLSEPHRVVFDHPEPGPVDRVVDNLLSPEQEPSVAADGSVQLRRELFERGAVIMRDVASRGLTYTRADGRGLRLDADGFTGWTLWTAEGGDFICLEPWAGAPAPKDFTGEFVEHPGTQTLAAGQTDTRTVRVTLL